jgi:hypothetical protein
MLINADSYSRDDEDLECVQHLIDAQLARTRGVKGISIDEFESNMDEALAHGVAESNLKH